MTSDSHDALVKLLNLESKKEVKRHCKDLVVLSSAFAEFILSAQAGKLKPYKYACHFFQRVPEHLVPSDAERDTASETSVELFQGTAPKFFTKIDQSIEERRLFAAHLFFTEERDFWHLFYFDQRDRNTEDNHWKHGAHLHYVNEQCVALPLDDVWGKVLSGNFSFPSVHIRYEQSKRKSGREQR